MQSLPNQFRAAIHARRFHVARAFAIGRFFDGQAISYRQRNRDRICSVRLDEY